MLFNFYSNSLFCRAKLISVPKPNHGIFVHNSEEKKPKITLRSNWNSLAKHLLPSVHCSLTHLAPCFELYYVKEVNLSLEKVFLSVSFASKSLKDQKLNIRTERNEMGTFFSLLFLLFWVFGILFRLFPFCFLFFWIVRFRETSFRFCFCQWKKTIGKYSHHINDKTTKSLT